jgi:outer membrane protein OmpA-like peptidoglycan-associated protein
VRAGLFTDVDLKLAPHPRAARFKATVINEKDETVPAEISLTETAGRQLTLHAANGTVTAEVPPGRYQAVIKAEGYLLSGRKVLVEAGTKTAEVFLLKQEPKKRLTALTTERIEIKSTIHFEHDRARLLSTASFILDEVVDTLLKNQQITKVFIEGHTDNTGDATYNLELSKLRAEEVRDYLLTNGVEADRVQAIGYGDSRPLAPNTTEAGRARNRRVDFVIVHHGEEAGPSHSDGETP